MAEMTLEEKVIDAINQIRPSLQNDGGDIEFVSMEGKNISVKLLGACAGCPMSQATLKNGGHMLPIFLIVTLGAGYPL